MAADGADGPDCGGTRSAIACYGSTDLMQRDEEGARWRIVQADGSVYVDPRSDRLPGAKAMMAGEDDFRDVVLEVDHTTDVGRAKLGLHEAWGCPEVWVEVADPGAVSRPRRRPGLTIQGRVAGAFQASATSGAFAGWTGAEIQPTLNETELSERTFAVLHRVGAALGARDGAGPDDDPMLGWHRRQARLKMVWEILRARGIAVSDEGFARVTEVDLTSDDGVARAALACNDEADFLARLRHRCWQPARRTTSAGSAGSTSATAAGRTAPDWPTASARLNHGPIRDATRRGWGDPSGHARCRPLPRGSPRAGDGSA